MNNKGTTTRSRRPETANSGLTRVDLRGKARSSSWNHEIHPPSAILSTPRCGYGGRAKHTNYEQLTPEIILTRQVTARMAMSLCHFVSFV